MSPPAGKTGQVHPGCPFRTLLSPPFWRARGRRFRQAPHPGGPRPGSAARSRHAHRRGRGRVSVSEGKTD
ncbi:hypothetical protein KCH_67420 [Kitasatospora cheerisanensis KCTC 2395]|uniref:Uncharacterized protein n=1 Tax=Kitasatospora cheerisanensis KCTC 2395 TaxID=1348663 RepID=A0A066YNH4_9ACTN|nr:hypothetical protein KCH_67420 [Kitasatospora cheerisanensis KCTC 2395]